MRASMSPSLGDRWGHVSAVGGVAESLTKHSAVVTEQVVSAAWLHDIGYSRDLAGTGFHPLDGALFLRSIGAPTEVVALVAHHTGAAYEAEERGLLAEWQELPTPEPAGLDVLTMIDLAVGPTGQLQLDVERIDEILSRYEDDHPVHRAVTRSRGHLLASSARGKALLGLPDDWPLTGGEGVRDAQPHGGVQR